MRTHEGRDLRRLLWPAALDGVCAAIIAALVFVALGLLHPAFALPPIGLGILGVLVSPARLRPPADVLDPDAADSPDEAATSA
jgi:hypothetical protein